MAVALEDKWREVHGPPGDGEILFAVRLDRSHLR